MIDNRERGILQATLYMILLLVILFTILIILEVFGTKDDASIDNTWSYYRDH